MALQMQSKSGPMQAAVFSVTAVNLQLFHNFKILFIYLFILHCDQFPIVENMLPLAVIYILS